MNNLQDFMLKKAFELEYSAYSREQLRFNGYWINNDPDRIIFYKKNFNLYIFEKDGSVYKLYQGYDDLEFSLQKDLEEFCEENNYQIEKLLSHDKLAYSGRTFSYVSLKRPYDQLGKSAIDLVLENQFTDEACQQLINDHVSFLRLIKKFSQKHNMLTPHPIRYFKFVYSAQIPVAIDIKKWYAYTDFFERSLQDYAPFFLMMNNIGYKINFKKHLETIQSSYRELISI